MTLIRIEESMLTQEVKDKLDKIPVLTEQLIDIPINVKSLGAKGDGIADDTLAIQTALNKARDAGGGEVYIPKGTYIITSILTIYSNTKLSLSKKTIMQRGANINAMVINGTQGTNGYNGDINVEIIGGIWDANKDQFPSVVTVIAFAHCKNILIRDCMIKNVFGWHHIELSAVKNGSIINCNLIDFDLTTADKEMIQLDLMINSSAFPWFGIYDNTPCDNILIEGCTFSNGARAIGSHSSAIGFRHTNIKITNCHFENFRQEAVYCYDYENVIVEGNTFTDCWIGINALAISNDCKGFVISNNTMFNMKPDDEFSRFINIVGKSGGVKLINGLISNNNVRLTGRHGITIDYCTLWTIQNNSVSEAGHSGIWAYGSSQVIVKDNISTGNARVDVSRVDIQIGGAAISSQDIIISSNITGKTGILNAVNRVVLTNNIASTSLTVDGTATNVNKINNFVANIWTP